jgi:hypothetical protein
VKKIGLVPSSLAVGPKVDILRLSHNVRRNIKKE